MQTMMGNMMHVAVSVLVQNVILMRHVQHLRLKVISVTTLTKIESTIAVVKMVMDKLVVQMPVVMAL